MSETARAVNKAPMVWIISTISSECASCAAPCKRHDHVLWLPDQPIGKNNLCRPCGEKRTHYPGAAYWQRREEKLNETEARLVHG